jgi:hypothetical protein
MNAGLKKKKLEAITVLTESDWQKKNEASASGASGMQAREALEEERMREMD